MSDPKKVRLIEDIGVGVIRDEDDTDEAKSDIKEDTKEEQDSEELSPPPARHYIMNVIQHYLQTWHWTWQPDSELRVALSQHVLPHQMQVWNALHRP